MAHSSSLKVSFTPPDLSLSLRWRKYMDAELAFGSSSCHFIEFQRRLATPQRAPVETDSFLNRAQLEELRKIQVERNEVQRRKVMGMDVPKNLGVRQEEKNRLYK